MRHAPRTWTKWKKTSSFLEMSKARWNRYRCLLAQRAPLSAKRAFLEPANCWTGTRVDDRSSRKARIPSNAPIANGACQDIVHNLSVLTHKMAYNESTYSCCHGPQSLQTVSMVLEMVSVSNRTWKATGTL